MEKISMGIGNFYGEVQAYEEHGKYYIELDDYSRSSTKEISKEFYSAIKKEFNSDVIRDKVVKPLPQLTDKHK